MKKLSNQKGFINILMAMLALFIGLLAFTGVITTIYEGVRYAGLKIDIFLSAPLSLDIDKKTGYKEFNVSKDKNFGSNSFFASVKGEPFVVSGGSFYKYLKIEASLTDTPDSKLKKINFNRSFQTVYGPLTCKNIIIEDNKKILEKINKLATESSKIDYKRVLGDFSTFLSLHVNYDLDLKDFATKECTDNIFSNLISLESDHKCIVSFFEDEKCNSESAMIYTAKLIFYSNSDIKSINGVRYTRLHDLEEIKFQKAKKTEENKDIGTSNIPGVPIYTDNCIKYKIKSDYILCSNNFLSGRLNNLKSDFSAIRHNLNINIDIAQDQKKWEEKLMHCEDESCIENLINNRLSYFDQIKSKNSQSN